MRNLLCLNHLPPIGKMLFLSCFFHSVFFFIFVFRSLSCLAINFFGFITFGILSVFWIIGSCLLPNLGSFQSSLPWVPSWSFLLFSSWGSDVQISDCLLLSHKLLRAYLFKSIFFLYCPDWIISIVLSSGLLILSTMPSISLLRPLSEFF